MELMVDNLKYYFKVIKLILKNSLIRDLTFKSNFFIRISTDLVWYVINILFFQIIYISSSGLGNWSIHEVTLFMGTMFIIDSLHMSIFYFNIFAIPQYIRDGTLDNFLLKPINSKFFISIRQISFSSFFNIFFGIFFVCYSSIQLNLDITIINITLYTLLVINGVVIMYSLLFIGAILSIHFSMTEGLMSAIFDLFQFGMKPEIIYNGILKLIITYIIPLLVIVNTPAKLLIDKISIYGVIWSFIASIGLYLFSNILWKKSLKKYSSATS